MVGIVSSGIGSGLDIAGIVQGLVAAEGQPVETRILQKEARAQAKLSAFGSLKSALSDLRDKLDAMKTLDGFVAKSATSSNKDVFTAAATGEANPATYDVEVVRLALAQRLTSGAFSGSDAAVGTGTLTVTAGTEQMNLAIDSENNTLAGIRDADAAFNVVFFVVLISVLVQGLTLAPVARRLGVAELSPAPPRTPPA